MKNYIKDFSQFQRIDEMFSMGLYIKTIEDKLTYEGAAAAEELYIELDQHPELLENPDVSQFAKDLLDNPDIATIRIRDIENKTPDDSEYEILNSDKGGAPVVALETIIKTYNAFIKSNVRGIGAELVDNKYLIITVDDSGTSHGIGKYYNIYAEKEDLATMLDTETDYRNREANQEANLVSGKDSDNPNYRDRKVNRKGVSKDSYNYRRR